MLEMNVNVAKARTILGTVSALSGVDSYLLLDDEKFCTILTKVAHEGTIKEAYDKLLDYIDNNY